MIRDRRNIKWTAMMLPEHLELIKKFNESNNKVSPKILSEWELEDLQQTVNQALHYNISITLDVWEMDRYVRRSGIIRSVNDYNHSITFETLFHVKVIYWENIHGAKLNDE